MALTDEITPKHLEFIQGVIERHARNSFILKGWSITLVAAIFLLAARGVEPVLSMSAAVLPSIAFWALDGYYLRQERMYRALYDYVRCGIRNTQDYFSLDASPFSNQAGGWFRACLSLPILYFHAAILFVVVFALIFFSQEAFSQEGKPSP